MLLLMVTFGGLLLMMGHQSRSESLFYYFRLEDQVPENHLLRLIDRHVNFEFIRAKLKDRYRDAGRPSIDPELLLRMLLVGYLYGVTSEREELPMHLAWRWFTGLGFDQEITHHSTFSKNRHGRFQEANLFQELFEEIVARCVAAGLVKGKHMSVDGSFIQANADHHSRVPPDQLAEVAKVNHTVREYLVELERENTVEPPVEQQDKVSTTDPDSTCATKGGSARLGYYDNYLVDNASCVIVGVQATPARLSHESVAARDMIERYRERYGYLPQPLAAYTTYGNGELLQWLDERGIAGYMRVKENGNGQSDDLYGIDQFTYAPEENCYICPEGKVRKYTGINKRNNTQV
jgi:transposase